MYCAASCGSPAAGGTLVGGWAAGGSCPKSFGWPAGVPAEAGAEAVGASGLWSRFAGCCTGGGTGRTGGGGVGAAHPANATPTTPRIVIAKYLRPQSIVFPSSKGFIPPTGRPNHPLWLG